MKIIEAQCSHVMNILGYELEYTDQLPKFSEEEIAEFRRLKEEGKSAKKASLLETSHVTSVGSRKECRIP